MYDTKFFHVGRADVNNGTLTMEFYRKYFDERALDPYCDALNPHWTPCEGRDEEYMIYIHGWKVSCRVEKYNGCVYTTTIRDPQAHFDVRTSDKRLVNWLWYLGAKKKIDYNDFLQIKIKYNL